METNVDGPLYVNTACINCDQCRQLDPDHFAEIGRYSAVTKQPSGEEERRVSFHALLACPTGAIVSEEKEGLREAIDDFPLRLTEEIYFCGFTSENSFGGSSYFIVHPEGNCLIDSPRWHPSLVRSLEAMGGVDYIFLTHRDDVADADRYARRFQARRLIHEKELDAQPGAEEVFEGSEPSIWRHEDFTIIPTPGHTEGHIALLYKNRFLFTGDHLSWNSLKKGLTAHRSHCWYSWEEQIRSMERLLRYRFEWIFPGHGRRIRLPLQEMRSAMEALILDMKRS